jgi:hypothetical protein
MGEEMLNFLGFVFKTGAILFFIFFHISYKVFQAKPNHIKNEIKLARK